jgi:hypothetical protein
MWAYVCIGMGKYMLKHFLTEKELKELKLTVHTSGESSKWIPDMSVPSSLQIKTFL